MCRLRLTDGLNMNPSDFWKTNKELWDITPRNERHPEVGLSQVLMRSCVGSVFEFGCGDGRLSALFGADSYAGYDINLYALEAAKKANPNHKYVTEWEKADTFLAHTVLLHVPDDEIQAVIDKAKEYPRIVIGEVMGRKWRREGNPPVFNRHPDEYAEMVGRWPEIELVPYPRYNCNLHLLIFK